MHQQSTRRAFHFLDKRTKANLVCVVRRLGRRPRFAGMSVAHGTGLYPLEQM